MYTKTKRLKHIVATVVGKPIYFPIPCSTKPDIELGKGKFVRKNHLGGPGGKPAGR